VKKNDHKDVVPDSDAEDLESDENESSSDDEIPEAPINVDTVVENNCNNGAIAAKAIQSGLSHKRKRHIQIASNLQNTLANHRERYHTRSRDNQCTVSLSPKLIQSRRGKRKVRVNEKMCYPHGFHPMN